MLLQMRASPYDMCWQYFDLLIDLLVGGASVFVRM